jgi:outer membrane protein assembly factor BamD
MIPARPSAGRRRLWPGAALAASVLLVLALSACGSDDVFVDEPVETLYNRAMDEIEDENWVEAAKAFDEVERQHPYSAWAVKAQLMAAYAHYRADQYDEAIAAADRFTKLHPGSSESAYAYYLRAISYYEQIVDVGRDQKTTELALDALSELIRRFPDTQYARDARVKLDVAKDHLAGKEMSVGRYYLQLGNYLAAVNRFRVVVEKYQSTSHVAEALHRLTECYLALGVVEEAQTAAAVLGHNYPGSEWYRDSYALLTGQKLEPKVSERSWLARMWSTVF